MKQLSKIAVVALALAGSCFPPGYVWADQAVKSLKDRLVGVWHLASMKRVRIDGSKYELLGPATKGMIIFESGGHYSVQITAANPSSVVATSATTGPAEEHPDFERTIAHFGTYTVNDKDRSITFRILSSSVPEWNGTEFKRSFVVLGGRFAWFNPNPSSDPRSLDSRSDPVWKRPP